MAALSDSALLTATREAIDALTTGRVSSYSLAGRTYTKLNLDELWGQVDRLEKRIRRASKGISSIAVMREAR